VLNYFRKNIWSLDKTTIDRKINFDKKYGGFSTGVVSKAWSNTFYRLLSLQKYYELFNRETVISIINQDISLDRFLELCPLALWEVNFNFQNQCYSFNSFNGETVTIKGKDIFLWESASGKNTISELIGFSNGLFDFTEQSLKYIKDFYKKLEDHFALIIFEF